MIREPRVIFRVMLAACPCYHATVLSLRSLAGENIPINGSNQPYMNIVIIDNLSPTHAKAQSWLRRLDRLLRKIDLDSNAGKPVLAPSRLRHGAVFS